MQTSNKSSDRLKCSVIVPYRKNPQGKLRVTYWIDKPESDGLEIVFVQDCLNSSEGEEIRNYLETKNKKNLFYFEGNFGSPGAARNYGLSKARADWVAFWDADDIPCVEQFLHALTEASESEAEILVGSFQVRREPDNSLTRQDNRKNPAGLVDQIALSPGLWRFAFKREILHGLSFPVSSMGEDQGFISSVALFDRKSFQSGEVVYEYFIGEYGHLTNNMKLMGDMKNSLDFLNQNRISQILESRRLTEYLIIKQLLTCIKRGNSALKIWASINLLKAIFISPANSSRALILFLSWRS